MKYGYFIYGYQLSMVYSHALNDQTRNTSFSISAKRLSDRHRIRDLPTDDGEILSFLAIFAQLIITSVYQTIGQMSIFHERPLFFYFRTRGVIYHIVTIEVFQSFIFLLDRRNIECPLFSC